MLGIINQVVDENWDELLTCAKDLIDAKLEDGEGLTFLIRKLAFKVPCNKLKKWFVKTSYKFRSYSQSAAGSFDFSKRTEDCEKSIFDAVKTILSKLPQVDGNQSLEIKIKIKIKI